MPIILENKSTKPPSTTSQNEIDVESKNKLKTLENFKKLNLKKMIDYIEDAYEIVKTLKSATNKILTEFLENIKKNISEKLYIEIEKALINVNAKADKHLKNVETDIEKKVTVEELDAIIEEAVIQRKKELRKREIEGSKYMLANPDVAAKEILEKALQNPDNANFYSHITYILNDPKEFENYKAESIKSAEMVLKAPDVMLQKAIEETKKSDMQKAEILQELDTDKNIFTKYENLYRAYENYKKVQELCKNNNFNSIIKS